MLTDAVRIQPSTTLNTLDFVEQHGCLSYTPDQIIARIRAIEAEGLTYFAFQVTNDPIGRMRTFAETVMQRYH